jgi:hypothetical protein
VGPAGREQEDGRGERPPDDAGEPAARTVDRGLGSVDPQLEAAADTPDLDPRPRAGLERSGSGLDLLMDDLYPWASSLERQCASRERTCSRRAPGPQRVVRAWRHSPTA